MSELVLKDVGLNLEELRAAVREEYATVALNPDQGFHFHTGRRLAHMLGYRAEWLENIPEASIESFAGTGNPFSLGALRPGERVVDVGSGAGLDSLIAARMVGPTGRVIGVDMTPAMLDKARRAAAQAGLTNVEFREGYAEALPVPDGWADVVISNGVLNLMPDKSVALAEMARVLSSPALVSGRASDPAPAKLAGRLQIADILVQKAVPESAKRKIDLWTG
jgi:SAM-dependent methyltransferase